MGLQSVSTDDLNRAMRHCDCRFRSFSDNVDLLALSNAVGPEVFRDYIAVCRELRRRRAG